MLKSFHHVLVSLVMGSPELNTVLQVWAYQGWLEMKITSLELLVIFCLMQPRIPLDFLVARAHCWLRFNLVSSGTPRSSSAGLRPAGWPLAYIYCWCSSIHMCLDWQRPSSGLFAIIHCNTVAVEEWHYCIPNRQHFTRINTHVNK